MGKKGRKKGRKKELSTCYPVDQSEQINLPPLACCPLRDQPRLFGENKVLKYYYKEILKISLKIIFY
jgi:hypothetical protein